MTENDSRLPIVAFMAGRFMDEMPGMSFGHAGTIVEGKEDTATEKIARLAEAGITVAEEIADIPEIVRAQDRERSARMRADAMFIDVEVDDAVAGDAALAAKLAEVCPVDIFARTTAARVEIVEHNLDECVLCRLCIDAAPAGHGHGAQALRRRGR